MTIERTNDKSLFQLLEDPFCRIFLAAVTIFIVSVPVTQYWVWQFVKNQLHAFENLSYGSHVEPPSYFTNLIGSWTFNTGFARYTSEITIESWFLHQGVAMIGILIAGCAAWLMVSVFIALGRIDWSSAKRRECMKMPSYWLGCSVIAMGAYVVVGGTMYAAIFR